MAYLALELADQELLESFAGLVAVANILESLGCVLATDIQHDLLTTAVRKKDRCQ